MSELLTGKSFVIGLHAHLKISMLENTLKSEIMRKFR